MEALLGIQGKDFVLLAADVVVARSIVVMKSSEDKSRQLNENVVMLYSGEAGDTVQFAEYIQCNSQLYTIRHDLPLSTRAAANFTRKELAKSLRSRVILLLKYVLCLTYSQHVSYLSHYTYTHYNRSTHIM